MIPVPDEIHLVENVGMFVRNCKPQGLKGDKSSHLENGVNTYIELAERKERFVERALAKFNVKPIAYDCYNQKHEETKHMLGVLFHSCTPFTQIRSGDI
ncbi:MAG: hypothetical protein FWG10_14520 [Eubacteriaceae bacterium]|nr:hypothetical protein [Eubacteriaceae bacterium]